MRKVLVYERISLCAFSALGLMCSILLESVFLSAVAASSVTGLLGGLIPSSDYYDAEEAQSCVFIGSFAGVSVLEFYNTYLEFFVIPIFMGLFFHFSKNFFKGFGGKLGAISFLCVGLFLILKDHL